jgi:hypothetical protein
VEPTDLGSDTAEMVLEAPGGTRTPVLAGARGPLPLERAGVYTVRPMAGAPGYRSQRISTWPSPDLSQLDRAAFLTAAAGAEGTGQLAHGALNPTAEERERRQRLWWYAALAALAIVYTESVVAGSAPEGWGQEGWNAVPSGVWAVV